MPRVLTPEAVSEFREKLLEVTQKLFADLGEAGVTMREIAAQLQVSPMTPYRYFKGKEEILAAARARAFTQFSKTLEDAYATPGTPLEKAGATGEAYIRFALENPSTYRLMFDIADHDTEKFPELEEAEKRARLTLTRHIPALIEAGIYEGDPVLIGHVFWVMLHGAVTLQLSGKLGPECDMRKILEGAFTALSEGFRPKKG